MNEIYTLVIDLQPSPLSEAKWSRKIEIPADATLEYLHNVIQGVVEFENDHLYEFHTAKTPFSRTRQRTFGMDMMDDFGGFGDMPEQESVHETKLSDIFPLESGYKLFYMFDFGDSWLFSIRKSNRKQNFKADGVAYPRVIAAKGENPEQYPDWE